MVISRVRIKRLSKTAQIWLILIPIFVTASLAYFLLIIPKARDIEKLQRSVKKIQQEIRTERQVLARFKPLSDEERRQINQTKRGISSLMESLGTIDTVYGRLTHQARKCNITGISIDPAYKPQEGETLDTETPLGIANHRSYVKLTFHSDFEALGCFLQGIEKTRDTIIASLTVTRDLPRPKTVLILKVFAKELR